MTIPTAPLELKNVDFNKLTLDNLSVFSNPTPEEFVDWANALRRFLEQYTTWTKAEIRQITTEELEGLITEFAEAVKKSVIPLSS
jgi:hypothetical protein